MEKREITYFEKSKIILFFIIIFSSFLFFCCLKSKSLWLDESFSYFCSLKWNSLIENIIETRANRSPYYIILHFWLFLGKNEFVLRSLSGIFGVLSIICIYLLGKELWNKKTGLIASFLLGINVFFIEYAREARNYSMLFFLVLLSSLFLLKYRKKKKKLYGALYVITTVLSVYTHIFALLVFFSQFVSYLMFAKNKKQSFWDLFPLVLIVFLFSLIPFSLFFRSHEHHASWVEKPGLGEIFRLLRLFSGGWLLCGIFLFFVLLFIMRYRKCLSDFNYGFVFLCFLLPVLIVFPIAYFAKPIYVPRYMIIILPFYILMVAKAVSEVEIKLYVLGVFLILSLRSFLYYYNETLPKEDWKNLYEFLSKEYNNSDDCIVFYAYFVKYPFLYYAVNYGDRHNMNFVDLASKKYPMGGGIELPSPDKAKMKNIVKKYKKVWLVLSHHKLRGIKRNEQAIFIINELKKNYNLILKRHFKGIELFVFSRKNK